MSPRKRIFGLGADDQHWPPTPLSGAERRRLRALGNPIRPSVMVGRAGPTDAVRAEVVRELVRTPLLKVKLAPRAEGATGPDATAGELASAVGAEIIARVGRTLLLYRPPAD